MNMKSLSRVSVLVLFIATYSGSLLAAVTLTYRLFNNDMSHGGPDGGDPIVCGAAMMASISGTGGYLDSCATVRAAVSEQLLASLPQAPETNFDRLKKACVEAAHNNPSARILNSGDPAHLPNENGCSGCGLIASACYHNVRQNFVCQCPIDSTRNSTGSSPASTQGH